jgi:hypothetical protein
MTPDAKAKAKAYRLAILARDPDYFKRAAQLHRERNPNYNTEKGREWRQANPARAHALKGLDTARRARRVPAWVTVEDTLHVYELAQEFTAKGMRVHVDHIVPLNHPLVCGLHVPANLRPCTLEGNSKKGNAFPSYFLGIEQQMPLL